jgi:hypothetical protein
LRKATNKKIFFSTNYFDIRFLLTKYLFADETLFYE